MTTSLDFGVAKEMALVEAKIRQSIVSEEPLLHDIARYVHDLIYRSLIEKWGREHSNFHFYPTISRPETPDWKGRVGYVQKVIENDINDYGNKQVFICGLHDMVEDVKNLCQRLGFAYVRFEKWD